jgi:hypothetical protein
MACIRLLSKWLAGLRSPSCMALRLVSSRGTLRLRRLDGPPHDRCEQARDDWPRENGSDAAMLALR